MNTVLVAAISGGLAGAATGIATRLLVAWRERVKWDRLFQSGQPDRPVSLTPPLRSVSKHPVKDGFPVEFADGDEADSDGNMKPDAGRWRI